MRKLSKIRFYLTVIFFLALIIPFISANIVVSSEGAANKEAAKPEKTTVTTTGAESLEEATAESSKEVYLIDAEGIINPVMSEYIIDGIDKATSRGAEVVVIRMDTPGGLDLSMRDIIKAIFASQVPVVVYVAPAGSRAASAGVFIAYSAHVSAMAPGTNMGSAHPVAMGGKEMDETMMEKVENDAAAYIKSIARKRGRNAEWAEKTVRESVNITADEAMKLKVIDMIAVDMSSLILQLDGRTIDLQIGTKTLETKDVVITSIEMGLRHRVLRAITNPNVAYVLMMIGMAGLYFELSNPGAIFPGVAGAISLILAFYAFQTLPVNYAGMMLIGLAAVFFIAEIQVASYGFLTLAGLVSLTLGSLMLFDSPEPFMRVSLSVIVPTLVLTAGFFVMIVYWAVRIRKKAVVSGESAMIGEIGTALSDIGPVSIHGPEGMVFVAGEYWNAESSEPIKKDEKVHVTSVDGLKLTVSKE